MPVEPAPEPDPVDPEAGAPTDAAPDPVDPEAGGPSDADAEAADAADADAAGGMSGGGGAMSRSVRRTDTLDPRRARERALKILFQSDVRGIAADELLGQLQADPVARAMLDDADDLGDEQQVAAQAAADAAAGTTDRPAVRAPTIDGFSRALVLGVAEHRDEVDALIGRYARRWQIHRMPVVDRTVLRLATYELLHQPTPPAVVIDQAVTLAKALSTDDSGRYVNGVLESIRKDVAGRRPSDA